MSHGAIFLASSLHYLTSLVELRCKLHEKLHRVTGPLILFILYILQSLERKHAGLSGFLECAIAIIPIYKLQKNILPESTGFVSQTVNSIKT